MRDLGPMLPKKGAKVAAYEPNCTHETTNAVEKQGTMGLRVDKSKFDAVLKKLAHTAPVKSTDVQIDEKKPAKIIPSQIPESERNK